MLAYTTCLLNAPCVRTLRTQPKCAQQQRGVGEEAMKGSEKKGGGGSRRKMRRARIAEKTNEYSGRGWGGESDGQVMDRRLYCKR